MNPTFDHPAIKAGVPTAAERPIYLNCSWERLPDIKAALHDTGIITADQALIEHFGTNLPFVEKLSDGMRDEAISRARSAPIPRCVAAVAVLEEDTLPCWRDTLADCAAANVHAVPALLLLPNPLILENPIASVFAILAKAWPGVCYEVADEREPADIIAEFVGHARARLNGLEMGLR